MVDRSRKLAASVMPQPWLGQILIAFAKKTVVSPWAGSCFRLGRCLRGAFTMVSQNLPKFNVTHSRNSHAHVPLWLLRQADRNLAFTPWSGDSHTRFPPRRLLYLALTRWLLNTGNANRSQLLRAAGRLEICVA